MKTILVTGGTGFLGSNLCRRLIDDGHRVICVDNNYTGRLSNVSRLLNNPNFKFVNHDICQPLAVDEHLDQIYNLACPASPPAYQGKHSIETTKTCVFGAINMLELAKAHRATILQTSTSEVYGEPAGSSAGGKLPRQRQSQRYPFLLRRRKTLCGKSVFRLLAP